MKIENMKKVNFGTVKAFFDVNFDKIIIKGWKLIQQENQRAFVTPPDEKYTDKEGKTKYKKLVDIPDEALKQKIQDAALSAYDEQ